MNCKKGDLAIIVIGDHVGKTLTCIYPFQADVIMPDRSVKACWVWKTDRILEGCGGYANCYVEDDILQPIRDQPGADETLTWAPVPTVRTKVVA